MSQRTVNDLDLADAMTRCLTRADVAARNTTIVLMRHGFRSKEIAAHIDDVEARVTHSVTRRAAGIAVAILATAGASNHARLPSGTVATGATDAVRQTIAQPHSISGALRVSKE